MRTLSIVLSLFLFSCGSSDIKQEGYFKDSSKNRIFTFSYKNGTTESEILSHAKKQTHTAPRLTGCYYYIEGSAIPRDGITLARSLFSANNVIDRFANEIKYAYIKSGYDSETFANCIDNPKHDLCNSTQ